MSSAILDKLFGSKIRVKLLKFLFRNYPTETLAKAQGTSPRGSFNASELSKRTQESLEETKKELRSLVEIGLLKKTTNRR